MSDSLVPRPAKPMTKAERLTLVQMIKQRERLAKTAARERSKRLMADFEQQADRHYDWDEDAVWRRAMEAAQDEVRRAQETVSERCREIGLPSAFAPTISISWVQQRSAASAQRAQIRNVAKRRVEQIEATAITAIEKASLERQEALMLGSLDTEAARLFAETLPTAEELMPMMDIKDLERQMIEDRRIGRGFGHLGFDG